MRVSLDSKFIVPSLKERERERKRKKVSECRGRKRVKRKERLCARFPSDDFAFYIHNKKQKERLPKTLVFVTFIPPTRHILLQQEKRNNR